MYQPHLHNTLSRAELTQRRAIENFDRVNVSFYRYAQVGNPRQLRDRLYREWHALHVIGRVYVAKEGINAQLAVPEPLYEQYAAALNEQPLLSGVRLNRSLDQSAGAFLKLDIKVRRQIVADGLPDSLFAECDPAPHLAAAEFHRRVGQGNAVVVDVRNDYECETGHFEGAVRPSSATFKTVLPELNQTLKQHKDKELLLYCTGGIRCEKASAYLRAEGYGKVFQLEGGILSYLRHMNDTKEQSKFQGTMFVFDGRMAESTGTTPRGRCSHCGVSWGVHRDCAHQQCHQLFLQCPQCELEMKGCCSEICREAIGR